MTDHRRDGSFRLPELVERLPLVVYVDELDEKSSPLYISPQIERLIGYSQEEWLADPGLFVKSLHPDDRERVARVDRHAQPRRRLDARVSTTA